MSETLIGISVPLENGVVPDLVRFSLGITYLVRGPTFDETTVPCVSRRLI